MIVGSSPTSPTMQKDFEPDWVSPPGDTIDDILQERQMTVEDLVKLLDQDGDFIHELHSRLQWDQGYIGRLLNGQEVITPELAEQLERVLGGSKQFWLRREEIYRQELERLGKVPS